MSVRCRTCGERIYNLNAKNLFSEANNGILIKIEALTGIWLTDELNMPDHICAYCLLDLNHAITFRERCIKTHELLLSGKHNVFDDDNDKELPSPATDEMDPLNSGEPDVDAKDEITDQKVDLKDFVDFSAFKDYETQNVSSPEFEHKYEECSSRSSSLKSQVLKEIDDFARSSSSSLIKSPPTPKAQNPRPSVQSNNKTEVPVKKRKYIKWVSLNEAEMIEMKRKMRQRNYVCDQCGRNFNDKANLKIHLIRHTGVKAFECKECGQKEYTAHLLKTHIRVRHKGELPYACKYCGERFGSSTSRCRHERRTHIQETSLTTSKNKYICRFCAKGFKTKACLKNHELIHTGERPFRCDFCDVNFQRRTHLTAHFRSKFHQKKASQPQQNSTQGATDEDIEFHFNETIAEEFD
ncbi:transcription factor Ouib-like [Scaptodrosophila lebanonensis]|uniref:Transcription factor Ouib-like n=1 Tax=Drosophila lebanonensis TaxID=7225 RepID=A0A6J2TFA6_DROLE|nr:transcription factor Ouib-like [Scaptodrosophila lebanonensis]